jgi:pimeloyl-ACP methyl ester carboxylesterase
MPAFADAGYYVIAPDCRGFGRTVGWDRSWDADPTPFLTLNMVRDQIALVSALGYRKAELIVGHDQGQLIATYAAIVRPDMFLRLTTVSSAGGAPPSFPVRRHGAKPCVHRRGARRGVREAESSAPRLSGVLGQQAGR